MEPQVNLLSFLVQIGLPKRFTAPSLSSNNMIGSLSKPVYINTHN